jgi:hypothetical protein
MIARTFLSVFSAACFWANAAALAEDVSPLSNAQRRAALIALHDAEIAHAAARHQVVAKEVDQERAIAAAKLQLGLARLAQRRFLKAESVQHREALKDTIMLADKRHKQLQKKLQWSKQLANQGLISQASLELDQAAAKRTESELKVAREQLRVYEQTTYARRALERNSAVKAAEARLALLEREGLAALEHQQAREQASKSTKEVAARRVAELARERVELVGERAANREAAVAAAKAALENAQAQRNAQREFHDTEVERADEQVETARLGLEEFQRGEMEQKLHEQRNAIRNISESLDAAQQQLGWSERVIRKGYITPAQLEKDRLIVAEKSVELKAARQQLQTLQAYTLKAAETELKAELVSSGLEKKRVERLRSAEIDRAAVVVRARQRIYELERSRLGGAGTTGAIEASAGGG